MWYIIHIKLIYIQKALKRKVALRRSLSESRLVKGDRMNIKGKRASELCTESKIKAATDSTVKVTGYSFLAYLLRPGLRGKGKIRMVTR